MKEIDLIIKNSK